MQRRILPGVSVAAAQRDFARSLADAAAKVSEDDADAAETSATRVDDDYVTPEADTDATPTICGGHCDAATPPSPDDEIALEPTPAEAVALTDANATAADDEAARTAAICLSTTAFIGEAATVVSATEAALIAIGAPTPPSPDAVAPPCFLVRAEGDKLSQLARDTSTNDVATVLSTAEGHTWLAAPLPRVDRQACHWLLDTDQGRAWLIGSQGLQWASHSPEAA